MQGLCTINYTQPYARLDAEREEQAAAEADRKRLRTALGNFLRKGQQVTLRQSGFRRMEKCRQALLALDRRGWERSFHQRQFHDQFLRACSRVFWKTEQPGEFARAHQQLLEQNGWPHLSQEILVSTPRRFGKTISVSMFAAAMIFSAPNVEVSIYSTCKRISQKLLRNIHKFLELIYLELNVEPYRIERMNMEEIAIHGPESEGDLRIVNSYPSKVSSPPNAEQLALTLSYCHGRRRHCCRVFVCACRPAAETRAYGRLPPGRAYMSRAWAHMIPRAHCKCDTWTFSRLLARRTSLACWKSSMRNASLAARSMSMTSACTLYAPCSATSSRTSLSMRARGMPSSTFLAFVRIFVCAHLSTPALICRQ